MTKYAPKREDGLMAYVVMTWDEQGEPLVDGAPLYPHPAMGCSPGRNITQRRALLARQIGFTVSGGSTHDPDVWQLCDEPDDYAQ